MSSNNNNNSSYKGNITPIHVTDDLAKCGVTELGRINQKIVIKYNFQTHDGQDLPVMIQFDLKPEFFDTLEEFGKKASKDIKLCGNITERTKAALSRDEYYPRALTYYDRDRVVTDDSNNESSPSLSPPPSIGEPTTTKIADDETQEREREEAYASSVSDPDYTDEGLPLLSVTSAIRKDPGRIRVCGIIDTVRPPFKLIKIVYFICRNPNCSKQDIRERHILDTPIFSLADMPIAFNGGAEEYLGYLRCPTCRDGRSRREIIPDFKKFANAKTVQLKNLERISKATTANNTLNLERLTVFVVDKHTLSVGFSEEVEIVGDLHVLASSTLSSRFGGVGGGGRGAAADSGRAHPILYAKRMKYTKRERELKLTEQDVKAIPKFASFPNLIPRLISMMSPEIYGHEDVKLGLLLVAVGAAPIQKDNWYRRHWLNAGLFGDKGTGKTTLAEDAAKLLPGSQSVSGQHSTGKGIVAIAEKEGGGDGGAVGAFLRAGAATLANNAICFIDEIGTMHYEDQEQFLSLMEKGYFNFNKLGIRQRIDAKTSFVVTANPMTGDWQSPDKISKDEMPLKGQLTDRLDFFFVFRKPRTPQEIEAFGNNMFELSKKHFRLDFLFLRKYLYYIHSDDTFSEIGFEDLYLAERLKDFWNNLMVSVANHEAISNRGFESLYRTAKAFARLMLKTSVDPEVVDETMKFIGKMYRTHGTQITEPVDHRNTAYLAIAKVIKDRSLDLIWAQEQQQSGGLGLDLDSQGAVTFTEAAETVCKKNENIRRYLGDNFRSANNKPARHLREIFREEREFDGGKIKVVSKDKFAELELRWVPYSDMDGGANKEIGKEESTTQKNNKNWYDQRASVTGGSEDVQQKNNSI
jgi:DNA replicative helicase MCM subunit Mcm2 (Cdc46/Mcm family)